MTSTATLTERYIGATIRSLPPTAQDDVRAELEASIADAVEARLEQGETPAEAERAVLTELGDPGILAASYADRPLHLIGPRFYLAWWRLLKLLLIIVPVCVLGGVALGQVIAQAPVGEVIGSSIAASLSSIVHIAFWTTLVFFILERTNSESSLPEWDVDQLPETPEQGAGRAEVIAALVFLGAAVGAVFWDSMLGFFPTGGDPIAILHPGLWPWGIAVLFALIVAEVLLAIAIYARGRWTTALAVVNTVLAVAFLSWALTLLVRGDLINPAFIEFVGGDVTAEAWRIVGIVTGFCIVAFPIWDIVDGWIKTARAERGNRVEA
jgi:hypothetical protein